MTSLSNHGGRDINRDKTQFGNPPTKFNLPSLWHSVRVLHFQRTVNTPNNTGFLWDFSPSNNYWIGRAAGQAPLVSQSINSEASVGLVVAEKKIRTVLIGIGNSASALIQGLSFYGEDDTRPGLWHKRVGDFGVSNIELVGAYDIASRKIGKDVAEAIFLDPNSVRRYTDIKPTSIEVEAGIPESRMNPSLEKLIKPIKTGGAGFNDSLAAKSPDLVVNLISSGMDNSSRQYAEAALRAGSSFVNATPTSIATDTDFQRRFAGSKAVIAGDDLMSQFGGTAFHKGILNFILNRGISVKKSYQLDVGGGAETLNTLDEDLRAIKRRIKTDSISAELPYPFDTAAGTTDYVDFLGNSRTGYFWIEGEGFLGSPVRFDIFLKTNDGPNAGGILIDLIRAVQTARDRENYGIAEEICAYGFKKTTSPRKLWESYEAFRDKFLI